MAKKPVSDELFPRHVRALARAVKEAESWRGSLVGNPDPQPLEDFDVFIAEAKEAMRIVRELGRQHAAVRRHRGW